MADIHMERHGTVALAVEEYTGKAVANLRCSPDPVVPGVYAFRAQLDDASHVEFLVRGVALHRVDAEDLEEVAFDTWPPHSA